MYFRKLLSSKVKGLKLKKTMGFIGNMNEIFINMDEIQFTKNELPFFVDELWFVVNESRKNKFLRVKAC